MIWGMLEISIKWPKCDAAVPLNGPVEVAHCEHRLNDTEVPHDYWIDIFKGIRDALGTELADGEGRDSTIFGTFNTTLLYGNLEPWCEKCKEPIRVKDDLKEGYVHTCPECGTATAVMPAPRWLQEATPPVRVLVNALSAEKAGGGKTPSAVGPVAFNCPSCGGGLVVDGTDRMVPCKFCGISVYLPDGVWLRLHPAKVKKRWFVGFDESYVPAKEDE